MSSIVSIILTSYNKPGFIQLAIESVIQQCYTNWELFIMDDNSNEETVSIISNYLSDPRIHYKNSQIRDIDRHKTTRYATLINEAIPKSKGKFISYLTDDNIYLPRRLELMVKLLEENQEIETVYSQQLVKTIDGTGQLEKQMVRKTYGILHKPAGLVDHCSVMHTREIADKIYNRYGNYWEDHPDLWFNADASFWNRLVEIKPFYPIPQILDIAIKTPQSFQRLFEHLPKIIPNGTLVKSPSSEIHLIDNQERRKISHEAFERLKYREDIIVSIPDPFMFKYKEGYKIDNTSLKNSKYFPNQRLIRSPTGQSVYFIQNGKKHLINKRAIREYNLDFKDIITLEEEVINNFPNGNPFLGISNDSEVLPDGIIFMVNENYYISFYSRLHPIDKKVSKKLKLNLNNAVKVNPGFIANFQRGLPLTWA